MFLFFQETLADVVDNGIIQEPNSLCDTIAYSTVIDRTSEIIPSRLKQKFVIFINFVTLSNSDKYISS